MSYIDGFLIPVRGGGHDRYLELARRAAPIFIKHGALRVVECWGDDVPDGTITDFRRAVNAETEETVVFSWVEWPDKATRDAAREPLMAEMMAGMDGEIPFDGQRMIFGGFRTILDHGGAPR